ncbi:Stb3 protein [Starmerella bacillaris]|uniref:Stb3 protein n=1 Tax=Starmerella bacillaris TaxID=1247836 RepID=A0AAV5RD35_STABA|nr:Stb3 protein [Starmerella bacillaris]
MDATSVRPLSIHFVKSRSSSSTDMSHIVGASHDPRPRSRSSGGSRQKLRQSSFSQLSANGLAPKPLNTHSPVAVAAAAAVTADKINKLLIQQGPLPIRHITAHLASTIPGFGELSLSKQRRLIIGVLESPKSEFVKVGWGRWAVRSMGDIDDSEFSTKTESLSPQPNSTGPTPPPVTPLGSQGSLRSLGSLVQVAAQGDQGDQGDQAAQSIPRTQQRSFTFSHRESIISSLLPTSKPPLSPSLHPVDDNAVFSDSESSSESEVENTDEEDWQSMGPVQLLHTSPREQEAIAALVQLKHV